MSAFPRSRARLARRRAPRWWRRLVCLLSMRHPYVEVHILDALGRTTDVCTRCDRERVPTWAETLARMARRQRS